MEDEELLNLWKSYDKKLNEQLRINRINAKEITKIKAKTYLISMTPVKLFAIVAGLLWVAFVDTLLFRLFPYANAFFLVSAAIQSLLTKIAIGVYLYQVTLIHRVNINEPVLSMQQNVARLKTSTLWVARILFLQLPLWTTFYLTKDLLIHGNIIFYCVQGMVTLTFTVAGLWLFKNISYKNKDKKWFRLIFQGKEWAPVMQAMDILSQIQSARSATDEKPE